MRRSKQTDAEVSRPRHGYLYLHITAFCKLIKLGMTFCEDRAHGAHSATFFARLLFHCVKIDLGDCTQSEAKRRLHRAENLIRFIFQNFLLHKGSEVITKRPFPPPPFIRASASSFPLGVGEGG
jgi:hypothetical protein